MIQMKITDKKFIKVIDSNLAEELANLGFSYIKEGDLFVFIQSDELVSVLQRSYSDVKYITESKLRF